MVPFILQSQNDTITEMETTLVFDRDSGWLSGKKIQWWQERTLWWWK